MTRPAQYLGQSAILRRVSSRHPRRGWDLLRVVLGCLLLIAVALKVHALATGPVAGTTVFATRGVQIAFVELELLLAIWLLSGIRPAWAWTASVMLFTTFAGVSLAKIVAGDATCGCFGKLPVSPWWSLAIDCGALVGLVSWPPDSASGNAIARRPQLRRMAVTAALFVTVGLPSAIVMATYQPATLGAAGRIVGGGEIVLLEPESWIGQEFPLFDYVDCERTLAAGKWLVVLHHHDCPKCQEVIPAYEQLAAPAGSGSASPRIALIELPPYGPFSGPSASSCLWCRLSSDREWFVTTPVEIYLDDGVVSRVSTELESVQVPASRDESVSEIPTYTGCGSAALGVWVGGR